ncbi:YceI family protein [Sphingomonas nostoxanthinifaciens]|uniref:YceI family protein n=1 Tax=Sphingomonas nostoxanthinifaciens TaxID=2872652 RepID=UPI001CC1F728|nr:YceI family protein [Sphingomonas nostoxanthinifaciens]UAK24840.1 YceI family protein [Sphingomonas nostoxanthinifaciens]
MRTALLALSLIAAPALAQAPAVPAGTYTVDTGHTQVLFTVSHFGVSIYTGQFTQPTGSLTLDPAHPDNDKVEVTFPIASVATTVPALNAHLQKPEFFDAAQFPEGKFVSTKVTVKGTSATIAGNLTLKGVTKPVVLEGHFVGSANNPMSKKLNIGFAATTTIKRSEFGVSYAVPAVSDDVKLTINAAFVAQ